jgi:ABC-type Fe3+-hydroxamate transport system substrate-binding protein
VKSSALLLVALASTLALCGCSTNPPSASAIQAARARQRGCCSGCPAASDTDVAGWIDNARHQYDACRTGSTR